jgi:hypothetical protein
LLCFLNGYVRKIEKTIIEEYAVKNGVARALWREKDPLNHKESGLQSAHALSDTFRKSLSPTCSLSIKSQGEGVAMQEFEEKFIKPIVNASYPGTLAALSLTVLQITGLHGAEAPFILKFTLLLGAVTFLLSAFSIFFYSIYPTRKKLWTSAAIMFLVGLFCLVISVLLLFVV